MKPPVTTLLPIPFLLWALVPSNPYAYYTFLRIVCCGCFGYTALKQHSHRRDSWTFAFVGLAVIYNPVFRVHLDRTFWGFANILTVVFLIVAYWKLHRQPQ